MERKQWQYGMNIYSGLMLFFLPWLLKFQDALPLHGWGFFLIGAAVVGFGALALHRPSKRAEWANLLLGAWMFISPWVLGFADNSAARNGAMVIGALVFLVSLWAKLERVDEPVDHEPAFDRGERAEHARVVRG
jgi:hypothetical protein